MSLLVSFTQVSSAQRNTLERGFACDCAQVESAAKTYLNGRGFTDIGLTDHLVTNLRTSKVILDARGTLISTERIRNHLASPKPPFFVWSEPMQASAQISLKPVDTGCLIGLTISFHSLHRMIVLLVPVNEALVLQSNGDLEAEYMEALSASLIP